MVYKNFVVHPDTVTDAHLAGCAAGLQGKFADFKRLFWKNGFNVYAKTRDASAMAEPALLEMAAELELNVAKLKADMRGPECKQRLDSDMKELSKFRVGATPSFFINGKFTMFGSLGPFKAAIDAELKAVEASGVPADKYYQSVVIEKGSKSFVSRASRGG